MAVDASQISSADASSIIDSALADAQSGGKAAAGTPANPILLPSGDAADPIAPPPDASTPEQKKEAAEQAKIRKAREDLLGKEEADRLAEEEAKQAAHEATLMGIAEKLANAGKSTANNASVKIGAIPTPGNVGFPLVLLAIFFFILITYNGNTRLQWLWLVLTNNAYISASQGASTSSTSSGPGPIAPPPEVPVGGGLAPYSLPILPAFNINASGMLGGNPYS